MDRRPRQTFAYVDAKGFDAETRTLRAVISTVQQDRHGEVVLPSAFEKHIAHYLANPVVLAGHQHRLADGGVPVIGMVTTLDFGEADVQATIRFAPSDVNPLGPQYERAYELGFMRAFSVGFIPIEVQAEKGQPLTHTESELIELSACSVPSNRQSLSGDKDFAALAERTPVFADGEGDPESGAAFLLVDPELYAASGVCKALVDVSQGDAVARAHDTAAQVRATILGECPVVVREWMAGQRDAAPVADDVDRWAGLVERLEAAATKMQECANRMEKAVSALMGAAEPEPEAPVEATAPDVPRTSVDRAATLEQLLDVLEKGVRRGA